MVVADCGFCFPALSEEAMVAPSLRFTATLPHQLTGSNSPIIVKYSMAVIVENGVGLIVVSFLCHQLPKSGNVMAKISDRCW